MRKILGLVSDGVDWTASTASGLLTAASGFLQGACLPASIAAIHPFSLGAWDNSWKVCFQWPLSRAWSGGVVSKFAAAMWHGIASGESANSHACAFSLLYFVSCL